MIERDLSHLRTARLVLRAFAPEDLDAALRIHCDAQTNRFNPAPYTPEKVHPMTQQWLADWSERGIGYWTVRALEDENAVLGFAGIRHKLIAEFPSLNLYFRFGPLAWGRGYAIEAAHAALDVAFNVRQEPYVHAMVSPTNTPSIKTLERAGLKRIREIEEAPAGIHVLYEITAQDFHRVER